MPECAVFGCKPDPGASFHYLPKVPLLRQKWLEFIYQSRAHTLTGVDVIRICSAHFSEESFFNYMQKAQGFAKKLILKPNAVPTFYPGTPTASGGQHGSEGNKFQVLPVLRHVACQTDPAEKKSAVVEKKHFRSTATQTGVLSRDRSVCTLTFPLDSPLLFLQPTILKRPSKRPRLSLKDEEEDPSECSL